MQSYLFSVRLNNYDGNNFKWTFPLNLTPGSMNNSLPQGDLVKHWDAI